MAANRLLESILDRIERENPKYQDDLKEALEDVNSGSANFTVVERDDIGEYIRNLSLEALSEV